MAATNVSAAFSYLYEPVPWINQPSAIIGIASVLMSLSALSVLLRLYIRWKVVYALWWDDLFVGLYLVLTLAGTIAVCLSPPYGLGKHLVLLTPGQLRMSLLLFYISDGAYLCATTFIKISLLFQYIRLYEQGSHMRRLCTILIILIGVWGSVFSFMAWVPCFPVHAYWDLTPGATCYAFGKSTERTAILVHTATNMTWDLAVLATPLPLYFGKDTLRKTKIGMVFLVLLGCLVNIFAAWRFGLLIQSKDNVFVTVIDPLFYAPVAILLATAEVTVASIAASIPIFWPVLSTKFYEILVTNDIEITHGDRIELRSWTNSPPARSHYKDSFIRDQVDPLRPNTVSGIETRVKSGKSERKWRVAIPRFRF